MTDCSGVELHVGDKVAFIIPPELGRPDYKVRMARQRRELIVGYVRRFSDKYIHIRFRNTIDPEVHGEILDIRQLPCQVARLIEEGENDV